MINIQKQIAPSYVSNNQLENHQKKGHIHNNNDSVYNISHIG